MLIRLPFATRGRWSQLLIIIGVKIDRDDLFGNKFPHCRNFLMFRMICIFVQGRAIAEPYDKASFKRALEVQDVLTNVETFQALY